MIKLRKKGKKSQKLDTDTLYVGTVEEEQAVLARSIPMARQKLQRRNPGKRIKNLRLPRGVKQRDLDRGF